MNFIGKIEGSDVRVELKYCERCGGLFLRRPAENRVYCTVCTVHLAQQTDASEMAGAALPRNSPGRHRMNRRGRAGSKLPDTAHIGCLRGMAEAGVWA